MNSAASTCTRWIVQICTWIAVSTAVTTSAQPVLDGRWIGGFRGAAATVAVDVTFGRAAGGLVGTLDIPQRAERGIPLDKVRRDGDRVRFELPAVGANMRFDGRLRADGRIEGTVRQGLTGFSPFELTRLILPADGELDGLYGTYVWDDDRVLLVAPAASGAVYVDYETGRTGTLYALSPQRLVGGPSIGTGYPVNIDITFERGPGGEADRARITRGSRQVEARRRRFYTQEEVRLASTGAEIAGTLLVPTVPGPHPALVMIHGSGEVTRDALRPFADHFARNGVAVLITDKRGTGASTGNLVRATFDELADDALAGVAWLRTRADIRPDAIGLHGASLGGWVAPLAASRSRHVAYVVVESAPTVTPLEHERLRVESQLRADGFSREDVARALSFMDQKFEVARTGEGWPRLASLMRGAATSAWLPYTNPPATLESLQWHWEHIFGYDPMPVLERLEVPVLVLYGELDTIVPPRIHRRRMEQALQAASRADVSIRVFDKANHGFFEAITGGRQEHARLAGFVPGYFEQRTSWVLAVVSHGVGTFVAESQD